MIFSMQVAFFLVYQLYLLSKKWYVKNKNCHWTESKSNYLFLCRRFIENLINEKFLNVYYFLSNSKSWWTDIIPKKAIKSSVNIKMKEAIFILVVLLLTTIKKTSFKTSDTHFSILITKGLCALLFPINTFLLKLHH